MNHPSTPKRKPGPAPGSPGHANAGRKPTPPATTEQLAFYVRWQLFPASRRPSARRMAIAMALNLNTFFRKMNEANQGAGLTAEQLALGNRLLDEAAPTIAGRPG